MTSWVGLLRGVNVGGKGSMSMATLKAVLNDVGLTSVQTYIQSGNFLFSSKLKSKAALEKKILNAIEAEFGFRPSLVLLSDQEFRSAVDENPFSSSPQDSKLLHFFFLHSRPTQADLKKIEQIAAKTEKFELVGCVFYLWAPDGVGRSKLVSNVERLLGVPTTARNLNTVNALLDLIP